MTPPRPVAFDDDWIGRKLQEFEERLGRQEDHEHTTTTRNRPPTGGDAWWEFNNAIPWWAEPGIQTVLNPDDADAWEVFIGAGDIEHSVDPYGVFDFLVLAAGRTDFTMASNDGANYAEQYAYTVGDTADYRLGINNDNSIEQYVDLDIAQFTLKVAGTDSILTYLRMEVDAFGWFFETPDPISIAGAGGTNAALIASGLFAA